MFYGAIRTLLPVVLILAPFFSSIASYPGVTRSWQVAASGAVMATLIFGIARPLFRGYVAGVGEYNVIYGSLAIGVIPVFWAWIVALITLLSGRLASHVQAMVVLGRSSQEVEQKHVER